MTSVTGARRRRLGLVGGTFDPPHIGHLVAAVSVRDALALDEVWLVPAGDPWQKRGGRAITPGPVRLEMAEAAVADIPGLAVSAIEVRRPGASYTIDTVEELHRADPDLDVVVVLGRDAAAGVPTWHRYEELLARCTVAVVDRAGAPPLPPLPGAMVEAVAMPRVDVSSTELRARVAAGGRVDVLVPAAVVAVIERERLYRSPS